MSEVETIPGDRIGWTRVVAGVAPKVLQLVDAVARDQAPALADEFYRVLLQDPEIAIILDHQEVDRRLRQAMREWIVTLLSNPCPEKVADLIALQKRVGEIHARIKVRFDHVLRGARILKRSIVAALWDRATDDDTRRGAIVLAATLIDLAMEEMAGQYSNASESAVRVDAAYQSHTVRTNVSLERERQRAALFDWTSRFLREALMTRSVDEAVSLGHSAFGMWVRHKARALFAADSELAEINMAIANIDDTLLPACRLAERADDPAELHRRVKQVLSDVERLGASTDAMFDQLIQLEAGRDALTLLLNRRFLPTILTREIELSRSIDDSFAIFLLDIDHFKSINDLHGHPIGDLAIKHVAEVLTSIVRSGDFLFRYGGEEFLVVCVEVDAERAGFIAEKIRKGIAAKPLVLDDGTSVPITVSIGIAVHDGHPDFERLIDRADKALYRAKDAGRNICITG